VLAEPSSWTARRKLALATALVSVAAAGGGGALAYSAHTKDREASTLCPQAACADASTANALVHAARTRASEADVAFGLAAIAAVGAGLLWFRAAPPRHLHDVGLAPMIGGDRAAVVVFGAF
jgi:hypothetical protein